MPSRAAGFVTPIAVGAATQPLVPTGEPVSVVIATYRRPGYLRAAMQSVLRQSSPPVELIIVDDGGTLPEDFPATEPPCDFPIRYLRLPRGGMCAARRAGFAASHGELLLFLDDDDELLPDAIATLRNTLARQADAIVAVGSVEIVDHAGGSLGRSEPMPADVRAEDLWLRNRIVNAGAALIRRAAYLQVGGWDLDALNAADYLLWLKLARIGRIVGTDRAVLRYRRHDASETAAGNAFLNLAAFRRAFRRSCPDLARTDVEDSVIASLVDFAAWTALWNWRQLIRRRSWRQAIRQAGRLISPTVVAASRPRSRRELANVLRKMRLPWARRGPARVDARTRLRVAGELRRIRFGVALGQFSCDPARGRQNEALLQRLAHAWGNEDWSASSAFLRDALARAATGNHAIIECGSGLSTVLLGVVTRRSARPLVALEHDAAWAIRVRRWLRFAHVRHVEVCHAPLATFKDYDWYGTAAGTLPAAVSLVICDGPSGGTFGGRSGLLPQIWSRLTPDAVILLDDAARAGEAAAIAQWSEAYPLNLTLHHDAKPYAVLQRLPEDKPGSPSARTRR